MCATLKLINGLAALVKPPTQAQYVNPCDPNHGSPATAQKVKGGMGGFVDYENDHGHGASSGLNYCDVMCSFDAENDIPIITTLAEEYAVMDKMFCSVPGPTWPNRMFALTATSLGSTETGAFYKGEPGKFFPQPTFFSQVEKVTTAPAATGAHAHAHARTHALRDTQPHIDMRARTHARTHFQRCN